MTKYVHIYLFPMLIHLLLCHPESCPIMHHEIWLPQQVGSRTSMLIRGTLPNMGQPCQASGPEDLSHSQEGLGSSLRTAP